MKKRLQSTLRFFFGNNFRKCRNDPSQEMMLVGKPGDAKSLLSRALRDVGPVDVCGDVCLADSFKWGIEHSMLRANLNDFAKFVPRKAVIDRENETALQTGGHILNPIKLRLICDLFVRRINENELVVVEADKFPGEIDRHCVEKLVRKMNSNEGSQVIERFLAMNAIAKFSQRLRLSILQLRKWLDELVTQRGEEFGKTAAR